MTPTNKNQLIGISLAVTATVIWSGNFIVARGVALKIPPVSLNFFRWLTATVIIVPFAWKNFRAERIAVKMHWKYFFWVSFTCIALFNTFVYVAGHHTSAINMALIGTTSSPVFTIVLAAIFLREKADALRITGLLICMTGILFLISQGSFTRLMAFHFSPGDWWILAGAFFFAIYNLLAKAKPVAISPINFLFVFCMLGTLLLLPVYMWEKAHTVAVNWNAPLLGVIVYLGIGTSFTAYLCWNAAIARIGSSRTALFGNLIPIFSTVEALFILDEKIQSVHAVSGALVIAGLIVANLNMPGKSNIENKTSKTQ